MEEEKKELKKQTRRKMTKDNENKNAKKEGIRIRYPLFYIKVIKY